MKDEQLSELTSAVRCIANAVMPLGVTASQDAAGGIVASLTESVMGISSGLIRIAESLEGIADALGSVATAIRDHGSDRS